MLRPVEFLWVNYTIKRDTKKVKKEVHINLWYNSFKHKTKTPRTGEEMAKAIISELSKLPKGAVKTITCDRGSEFSEWRKIEKKLNCIMYFADPYCAWQKGTNENLNGLLREFYQKGRNLGRVSEKTLKKNPALINAGPKKVLRCQKLVDLFNFFLSKCCS